MTQQYKTMQTDLTVCFFNCDSLFLDMTRQYNTMQTDKTVFSTMTHCIFRHDVAVQDNAD